jgi:hypothetical protein
VAGRSSAWRTVVAGGVVVVMVISLSTHAALCSI